MSATAANILTSDLQTICGSRLQAVVVYGPHAAGSTSGPLHTLALVERLDLADLEACARRHRAWAREGLATPLLLDREEFARSLDVFPMEFGAILAHHQVVFGTDPFEGLSVHAGDLRRACEVEIKGHLLHLRESYVESGGDPEVTAEIVHASAPALRTLLEHVARLDGAPAASNEALTAHAAARLGTGHGGALGGVLTLLDTSVATTDAARLFPSYLGAVKALARYVDDWRT